MKHFMIRYRFKEGSREDWHRAIDAFVAAVDSSPALKGKIRYRVMNIRGTDEYCHLAAAADDAAIQALQSQEFFKGYNAETRRVAGGAVEVVPLDVIAETA
jgi:hypothetical protein